MELSELKKGWQDHFTDGLVIIVGCGLSSAEGIPGMRALSDHLQRQVPSRVPPESNALWDQIASELAGGRDLESTLLQYQPDAELEAVIVELSAGLILDAETSIIEDVISDKKHLRFAQLLRHMLKPNTGIPVVTTNYDRLIEVAAEVVGLGVDALFVGHHLAYLNPTESRYSLCRGVQKLRKTVHRTYAKHLVVLKPHGSLDWFLQNNNPIRCPLPLNSPRLVITPGLNKFRGGYDRPFDTHRERANREIDRAARYLVLGYGFNDDHLQTHLEHQLLNGKPTLLITHTLSDKAQQLVSKCSGMVAISADPEKDGATVSTKSTSTFFPGPNLWDLGVFISEVLQP